MPKGRRQGPTFSTRPGFGFATGVNVFGLIAITAGVFAIATVAITFPMFIGCLTISTSPLSSTA